MNLFQSLILSAVEGISEFLPISSTGHLILASDILKIAQTNFVKDFEIIIQLGAILAVVVLYWRSFLLNKNTLLKVLAAFAPTAVVGLLLFKIIKNYLLGDTMITLVALIAGGIILIILEYLYKEKDHHADTIEKINYKQAFLIGVIQSISVIPGVSRSASTIIGGLFLGLKRKTAVEFSFLLAVPTIAAATGLDILKSNLFSYSQNEYIMLFTGFIGAFIFALISIKFLLDFVKKYTFIPFGIYRIIAAILFYLLIVK